MLVILKNLQMTKVSLRLSINLKRRDEAVVELLNVRRSEQKKETETERIFISHLGLLHTNEIRNEIRK